MLLQFASVLLLLHNSASQDCKKTVKGPDPNKPCVLPFTFQNTTYEECTNRVDPKRRFWCSTKTDEDGNHVVGGGHWGYCNPECNFGDAVNWPEEDDGVGLREAVLNSTSTTSRPSTTTRRFTRRPPTTTAVRKRPISHPNQTKLSGNSRDGNWLPDPERGECGYQTTAGYIVGGRDARPGRFPFMAAVGYKPPKSTSFRTAEVLFNCGGVLINKRYVLTAAHCHNVRVDALKIAKVYLGASDFSREDSLKTVQQFDIEDDDITVHEGWASGNIAAGNDIALIRLPKLAKTVVDDPNGIGQYVLPVCLDWRATRQQKVGSSAYVLGWGRTSNSKLDNGDSANSGFFEPRLQSANVPLYDFNDCQQRHYSHIAMSRKKQFCAGGHIGTYISTDFGRFDMIWQNIKKTEKAVACVED